MKVTRLALAACMAWGVHGLVQAQQPIPEAPNPGVEGTFDPNAAPSPSDLPSLWSDAPPAEKMYAPCDSACQPWRLCHHGDGCWNLYGWADAGVTANSRFNDSRYNGVTTFNDRHEGMLNQFYAVMERTICTGGCGWDFGGRVDLLYGTDYIFTQALGLELDPDGSPGWNGSPFYGLAMPQAYGEVGYGNLSTKIGHFYTPMGYESVMAPNNFFYSHAYTMQYGRPQTHTGALATYRLGPNASLIGGLVNGWDAFDRVSDPLAYIGGFTWNSGDRLSLAFTVITGMEPTLVNSLGAGDFTPRHMYSFVANYQINDCWTYVFQHDLGHQDDAAALVANDPAIGVNPHAEWYGINQYLFRQINDCWSAGFRFEWFRDDDGVRVTGLRPDAGHPLFAVPGRFAGDFYEMTAGLNWKPNNNIVVRPELRYDWYDGINLNGIEPFSDGNRDDQFLAAVDVIVLW